MIKFFGIFDEDGKLIDTFSSANIHLRTPKEIASAREISMEQVNEFNTRAVEKQEEEHEPTLLEQLEQAEAETGYTRLVRDMYFNIKKLGGTTNPAVYKKMVEIDIIAKQYRKSLKEEKEENENAD